MGGTNAPYVMTFANSIIGVSILAMPYCFKQCGVLLASLILILSSIVTRLSCHYLLKSAIISRRRNFEFLAFHVFGSTGKMAVELSIIFLMIGTCIAFFVVMGDLGPEIVGTLVRYSNPAALRPSVLIGLAAFVVLPLGMLRNVDSLGTICTASFVFYFCLVLKIFMESTNNLILGDWINDIHYWRPSGILQCTPIFSMALSCQTQLFEIFDSLSGATLDRMNAIIKSAVNLCTVLYISVGFFGYVAYYKQNFTGNVLMSFSPALTSDIIKIGFVLSVAVTFPLVIFPCRASMNSLLFRKAHTPHYELVQGGGNHIPEARFKCITLFVITIPLIIGLLAPNIEIVLGLLGSTIGVVICVLFPPLIFIHISSKATSERLIAQIVFALGIFIMVMGTYTNLYLTNENAKDKSIDKPGNLISPVISNGHADSLNVLKIDPKVSGISAEQSLPESKILQSEDKNTNKKRKPKIKNSADNLENADKRKEPPIPEAPDVPPIVLSASSNDNKVPSEKKNDAVVAPSPSADKISDGKPVALPAAVVSASSKESEKIIPKPEGNLLPEQKIINEPLEVKKVVDRLLADNDLRLADNSAKKSSPSSSVVGNNNNNKDENNVVNDEKEKSLLLLSEKQVKPNIADSSQGGKETGKRSTHENISALIKDSVPLPIAVNQNQMNPAEDAPNKNNPDNNEVPNEIIQQRDILERKNNDIPIEREKRDLEFVSTVPSQAKIEIDDKRLESSPEKKKLEPPTGGSFVKNIVQQETESKDKVVCPKTNKTDERNEINDANDSNNESNRPDLKTMAEQALQVQEEVIDQNSVVSLKGTTAKTNNNKSLSSELLPDKGTLADIIAPSRLSVPELENAKHSVVLAEVIDKDPNSNVDIKPMKRDLKSIDGKKSATSSDEETDEKKVT